MAKITKTTDIIAVKKAQVASIPNSAYKLVMQIGLTIRATAIPAPKSPVQVPCNFIIIIYDIVVIKSWSKIFGFYLRIRAENFTENDVAHHYSRRHSGKDENDADYHLFHVRCRNLATPRLDISWTSSSLFQRDTYSWFQQEFNYGNYLEYLPLVKAKDAL